MTTHDTTPPGPGFRGWMRFVEGWVQACAGPDMDVCFARLNVLAQQAGALELLVVPAGKSPEELRPTAPQGEPRWRPIDVVFTDDEPPQGDEV